MYPYMFTLLYNLSWIFTFFTACRLYFTDTMCLDSRLAGGQKQNLIPDTASY